MENPKRILVIRSDMLVALGIEASLLKTNDFTVEIVPGSDENAVNGKIKIFKPEVIVMDDSIPLSRISRLIEAIENLTRVRVLVVHAFDNQIDIFNKHEFTLKESSDLITAAQDC